MTHITPYENVVNRRLDALHEVVGSALGNVSPKAFELAKAHFRTAYPGTEDKELFRDFIAALKGHEASPEFVLQIFMKMDELHFSSSIVADKLPKLVEILNDDDTKLALAPFQSLPSRVAYRILSGESSFLDKDSFTTVIIDASGNNYTEAAVKQLDNMRNVMKSNAFSDLIDNLTPDDSHSHIRLLTSVMEVGSVHAAEKLVKMLAAMDYEARLIDIIFGSLSTYNMYRVIGNLATPTAADVVWAELSKRA